MAIPIREQVLSAFFTSLQGITEIDGLRVERNRDADVQHFPTLILVDGDQSSSAEDGNYFTRYTMKVQVEGFVLAADLGGDLNQLYAKTVQAVTQDVTLGGLAHDVTEEEMTAIINRQPGQERSGAFIVGFTIIYFARQGDPYTLP